MGYLDRFSNQGLDGDKLQSLMILGIAVVGFILLSIIVSAIFPAPPSEPAPNSKDVGINQVPIQTPQAIPQVSAPTVTPTPTPNVTSTPRNYDRWGNGGSSSGSSSSHTHTPTPTPTPIPYTRAQLLNAVYVNNSDGSLNLTITDSLNATNNETLRNIIRIFKDRIIRIFTII